ncbi:hypothetical protein CIRG_06765 [Coccidioides immitis RMSCC 2394]|uniref:Mediator of RNA polymerase II transcription subunit 17 n=1 Tax=Coccidioides immitis RMSCC 2394 TaxID=404692 RepID=A0A0J6YJ25_COCIT|nr:hypothetical protein CIRG_06765 [Coccidioides immitis RMSCC 2394]
MSNSFTLPLRPARQKANREDDLAVKIAQINAQKGSFRDVTEASLLAEIEAARAVGDGEAEAVDVKTGEDEEENREEKLFKSRLEISQFAMNAHMEATYALEFVSLLLSKHAPRQAETSMSPLLKQKVPLGSLGADHIKPPEQSETQKRDVDAVSRGWKLESFDAAANKLLQSAQRLEEDIAAETKYWSEVLKIKEKGWKVCRLPQERQTLGVHFGFLESTQNFRDRGLAALRKGEAGRLILHRGIQLKPPRFVRVRVQRGDQTLGLTIPAISKQLDDQCLDGRIREARDSLYEEELFYELNREARVLLQYGVEIRRDLLKFPADDNKHIFVDLVGLDEALPDIGGLDPLDNLLAEGVAKSFRILLSYAHRKNHHRRTRVPPPVTPNKRPAPEYNIIRPLLCYFQHRSHYQWFTSFFGTLSKTLRSAGLKCSYTLYPLMKRPQSRAGSSQQTLTVSSVERLIDTLINPSESIISCNLISQGSVFRVRITTNVNPNGLGSEFELVTNLAHFPAQQSPFRFGLREDVRDLIIHLFTLDLVYLVPSLVKGSASAGASQYLISRYTGSQAFVEEESTDENEFAPSPAAKQDDVYLLPWQPTFPQQGELTAYSPARCRTKKLQIQLQSDQLQLRCFWVRHRGPSTKADEQPGERLFTWRAVDMLGGAEESSRPTLQRVMELLGEKYDDQTVQNIGSK